MNRPTPDAARAPGQRRFTDARLLSTLGGKGMSRIRSSRLADERPKRSDADSRRRAPTLARAARSLAASEAEKTAVLLRATQRLANVGAMVFSDAGQSL